MSLTVSRTTFAALAATALALHPALAQAEQACISEDEVSALAIYSMPSLVQSLRLQCGAELSASGFVARRGDAFSARFAGLQSAVWPRAKSGLLKYASGKSTAGSQNLQIFANLPDNAVRPLIDALIVQEISAKIGRGQCSKIERVMEAVAPIDPQVAGNLIGVAAGLFAPDNPPICPAPRR